MAPEAIGIRRGPDGLRLAFRRGCVAARAGVVPAWALDGDGASHSAVASDGISGRRPMS